MSYILDALKKAETERNLGEIPGIHAQPLHLAARVQEHGLRHDPWRWIALACAALMLGLAGWKWWPAGGEKTSPMPVSTASHSEPLPPAAKTQETTASPSSAPESAPAQEAAPATAQEAEPATKPSPKKTRRRTRHAPSGTSAQASRSQTSAETPLADVDELPQDIQRQIPALAIGGYIYSVSPADRSVLINQHLLREGDQISPGLILKGIRSNGILLDYNGRLFSMPY